MADNAAPRAAAPQSTSSVPVTVSMAINSPAPAMAGVASNIENLAALSRVIPVVIPAIIVNPEREIPGSTAKIWATPMIAAWGTVGLSRFRVLDPRSSPIKSAMAVPISSQPTDSGLRKFASTPSFSSSPPMASGIVPTIIRMARVRALTVPPESSTSTSWSAGKPTINCSHVRRK